ncbi:MAG: sulfofructose kinase [Granulosicoccus sp.]|jgi:sulfofructose kinase
MGALLSVTGVGTAVVDYVGVVDHYPAQDTQIELQTFSKQTGGNVATAMVTLARLGAKASFLGKFGEDELGKMVHADLTANGVDLSGSLRETGGSMGFAFIIVEAGTGRRTILWTGEGKSHLAAHEVDREAILASRYLHLDHYSMEAAIAAARIAKEGNVQVVLDAEHVQPGIEELLPLVDVLIACADFAYAYTGTDNCDDALAALFDNTAAHTVAITAGDQGSYCRTAGETHRQIAFPIKAVDTTGCGDVYHGAFIFGLMQDWPLAHIAEFASAAATLNCRGLGGQSAIPDLQEVEDFLAVNKC